jgi:hypothetical protein
MGPAGSHNRLSAAAVRSVLRFLRAIRDCVSAINDLALFSSNGFTLKKKSMIQPGIDKLGPLMLKFHLTGSVSVLNVPDPLPDQTNAAQPTPPPPGTFADAVPDRITPWLKFARKPLTRGDGTSLFEQSIVPPVGGPKVAGAA